MKDTYLISDYRSLELHRLVAKKIADEPFLLQKALDNINRWQKQNKYPQPYLSEWILYINKGLPSLLSFLVSKTDEAQRLSSSSPFVGLITQEERAEVFRRFNDHDRLL